MPLPLTDDPTAISRSLWYATNRGYARALDGYLKVKTEQQVRAKEEDTSADFSSEQPQTSKLLAGPSLNIDRTPWEQRVRELSHIFSQYPDVFGDMVQFQVTDETDYFVSSEGSRTATPGHVARLVIMAHSRAADGMDLVRAETFEADSPAHLPDLKVLTEKTNAMGKSLEALREAPVTQPFNGPAILRGRASAVFFHEVLGHRLEGQRQRGDEEGQTFTKLLGKQILPTFLSVADDPTLATSIGTLLSGHFEFDDEGEPARRVDLIKNGVLKTFLMSRLPVASVRKATVMVEPKTGACPQAARAISSSRPPKPCRSRSSAPCSSRKRSGRTSPMACTLRTSPPDSHSPRATRRRPSKSFRWWSTASMSTADRTSSSAESISSAHRKRP